MSMGKGHPYSASKKQKLHTRSSTELELVGVDNLMPMVLWTRYFFEAQGYNVAANVMYQDNKSTILLENNAKSSSGQRTKYINLRYFFLTDQVKMGELSID